MRGKKTKLFKRFYYMLKSKYLVCVLGSGRQLTVAGPCDLMKHSQPGWSSMAEHLLSTSRDLGSTLMTRH